MAAALYHSAYVIIGGGILPATIMIVCACLIRQNLSHKQQRRVQLSSAQRQDNSLNRQVLKILFIQIICYILFIIPQMCNVVFNTISITILNRSNDHLAVEEFVAFIAECVLYLFPVTSFYLYTLTSRTFRNELIKFFRGNNQITSITTAGTLSHRMENEAKLPNT
jgi:H+/gluconate symporter-like permease